MKKFFSAILIGLVAQSATAQDSPFGNETPAAEQAPEKAATETAAPAAEAKEDKEFVPPPGFQTRKRGKMVLYCKRDRETGTRFTTEKCYDEDQVREYLLVLEVQKRDIDRIRSTCATSTVCSPQ